MRVQGFPRSKFVFFIGIDADMTNSVKVFTVASSEGYDPYTVIYRYHFTGGSIRDCSKFKFSTVAKVATKFSIGRSTVGDNSRILR